MGQNPRTEAYVSAPAFFGIQTKEQHICIIR